ncbi:MAG: hypothetical protein A3A94_01245 [Candidatus Portnoybacteria bacterium RIFCSPLOWO2_01_FULL_43_11]|uniref:Uncharacterized protein n=3 Tax=Candidatus Portnoyibacteriota TaxID=1817913 RepID=A0A1G2FDZ5_9BACT|nr:MAG: hypothetical protein A2815_00225 [Candidatus Portnoybacteria bacterium RIFCSPHIGHO2_01_FULL_40_12b]OGZ38267.1 MAG: hypothetical protein A3E90_02985 [Candidatus Portnoybacteria bacterium RIFCSPHIGHO2_12_FULL_40_11]OGZ38942.1 MAG: hypothetical protein A3A94_01245 [Candidatus Portnoybacteria bacterium RIFCSPLOWO2_01_FULL_43_11]
MPRKKLQQNIIEELGLTDLPEETQTKLLTGMTESILKRITLKIWEELPEKDRGEFEKVRAAGEPEKIDEYLHDKIPNYEEKLQGVIKEFKDEMKDTIADLKNKMGD